MLLHNPFETMIACKGGTRKRREMIIRGRKSQKIYQAVIRKPYVSKSSRETETQREGTIKCNAITPKRKSNLNFSHL